jgi:hypothetical protein
MARPLSKSSLFIAIPLACVEGGAMRAARA